MTQNKEQAASRPGWRGPGMAKASKSSQKSRAQKASDSKPSNSSAVEVSRVPAELQQQILNIYKHTFSSLLEGSADALKPLLQEVKQTLFERDFERAFGR
jgi:25S rRNA (uracil2843-N3)-methyltransferase